MSRQPSELNGGGSFPSVPDIPRYPQPVVLGDGHAIRRIRRGPVGVGDGLLPPHQVLGDIDSVHDSMSLSKQQPGRHVPTALRTEWGRVISVCPRYPHFHRPYGYDFTFRFTSDLPAGPRLVRDCAKGLRPPMRPTVCFGVGRFTLTQSSWPALPRCSRKWMSGYAGQALTENEDRRQFGKTTQIILALGESSFPSEGKSPFPLDFYLSWMSPISEVKMESLLLSCRALSSPTMSRLIPALGCPLPP
jgi:hypothetical protein